MYKLYRISQKTDNSYINKDEITKIIEEEIDSLCMNKGILKGKTVGITAGSRGIDNYFNLIKPIVDYLLDIEAKPIIIAAMGSHGGASVEGQLGILKAYGITEESIGVPVKATIKSVYLGKTDLDIPVYCNDLALEVDYMVLFHKINIHTDFTGEIESGLYKIMTIGLGNFKGASTAHEYCMKYGYEKVILNIAEFMKSKLHIVFGVGIIENSEKKLYKIKAAKPENLKENEAELLRIVKNNALGMPFKEIDVLLVHEIGKNISGGGMDGKIVGRIHLLGQDEPHEPKIKRIVVYDITEESHGNHSGLGLADFSTQRVFNKIDMEGTAVNCITGMAPEYSFIPCIVKNDEEAFNSAIRTIGAVEPEEIRIVYIRNTAKVKEMYISEALLEEAENNNNIEILSGKYDLKFDEGGHIVSPIF